MRSPLANQAKCYQKLPNLGAWYGILISTCYPCHSEHLWRRDWGIYCTNLRCSIDHTRRCRFWKRQKWANLDGIHSIEILNWMNFLGFFSFLCHFQNQWNLEKCFERRSGVNPEKAPKIRLTCNTFNHNIFHLLSSLNKITILFEKKWFI